MHAAHAINYGSAQHAQASVSLRTCISDEQYCCIIKKKGTKIILDTVVYHTKLYINTAFYQQHNVHYSYCDAVTLCFVSGEA